MDERKYIGLLEERRKKMSDEMLWKPDGTNEFSYGHLVGVNHGLRLAADLLLEMLADEKETDR